VSQLGLPEISSQNPKEGRMKRFAVCFFTAIGFVLAATAVTAGSAPPKVTICHRTASAKKPYVKMTVSSRATLRGHQRHLGDIIPAPAGGCPTVALTPTTGGTLLTATLTGATEVPGPGDPDGSGTATFRMIRGSAVICFQLSVHNIMLPATAAHIHQGAAGIAGAIVVPLTAPGAAGTASGCVNSTRTIVGAILDNPAGYYANVHTTDYPNGAIRGQL
jgi:hypothetical protein